MKNINKREAELIRQLLEAELPAILKKHNLNFELGNAVYDGSSVKFNGFRLSTADAKTPAMKELDRENEFRKQINSETILRTGVNYKDGNKTYHLVGYKPRARKKPYIIECLENGDHYVVTEKYAEEMFGGPNPDFDKSKLDYEIPLYKGRA